MAQYEQTYNQPIARVINVSQELGINVPLAARLPERFHLAATWINRSPQYQCVCDAIEERLQSGNLEPPILFVLQGHRDDLHRAFVLRLEKIDFASGGLLEGLGEGSAYFSMDRCEWPSGRDHVAMLRSLANPLQLRERAKPNEIEEAIASKAATIGFSHHVGCARWRDNDPALLSSWLEYMHRSWPKARYNRLCIGFLCVEYDAEATDRTNGLKALIADLRERREAWPNVHVLDPLDEIDNIHVGDWVGKLARTYSGHFSQELLLAAEGRLFPSGSRPRRLAEIYGQLFEIMSEAYRKPENPFKG